MDLKLVKNGTGLSIGGPTLSDQKYMTVNGTRSFMTNRIFSTNLLPISSGNDDHAAEIKCKMEHPVATALHAVVIVTTKSTILQFVFLFIL